MRRGAAPRATSRRSRSRYSRSTSPRRHCAIPLFATRTRSSGGAAGLHRRNASRSSRFARLRTIAEPTFRDAASPRRAWPQSFDEATSRKRAPSNRAPTRNTRLKSAARVRRSHLRSRASGGPPTGRLRSEPLAPFFAPPLEHETATFGPHPDEKAVGPLSLPIVRLERPLHRCTRPCPEDEAPMGFSSPPEKGLSLEKRESLCQTLVPSLHPDLLSRRSPLC